LFWLFIDSLISTPINVTGIGFILYNII